MNISQRGRDADGLRIACTGFVSEQEGSVAAANALLLGALLDQGIETDFFSKPSFVDPRPTVGERKGFRFVPAINSRSDGLRRRMNGIPFASALAERNDAFCYHRLLIGRMRAEQRRRGYDAVLWLGDYARGKVAGIPTISFAQGAPGTDARSVLRRRAEIWRVAGWQTVLKWELLARLRLSPIGLPPLDCSDHIIVGSSVSREQLCFSYSVPREKISTLPYPIDLDLFRPRERSPAIDNRSPATPLRVLWLGRIVPRKRLDLFLEGAAVAIKNDVDLTATVIGNLGFVPGYEKLIADFPFPTRLAWRKTVPRADVPEMIRTHDVLVQPSEEENFGSSVAEAQACGIPVIVGKSNGNSDYLCPRDLHLTDDSPRTLADVLQRFATRRKESDSKEWAASRAVAMNAFSTEGVAKQLRKILQRVVEENRSSLSAESRN